MQRYMHRAHCSSRLLYVKFGMKPLFIAFLESLYRAADLIGNLPADFSIDAQNTSTWGLNLFALIVSQSTEADWCVGKFINGRELKHRPGWKKVYCWDDVFIGSIGELWLEVAKDRTVWANALKEFLHQAVDFYQLPQEHYVRKHLALRYPAVDK